MNSYDWAGIVFGIFLFVAVILTSIFSQLKRIADALEKKETRKP